MTHTFVSMIRGINVGGNKAIKMDRLRAVYGDLGLTNAATYLQSGNVVFRSEKANTRPHESAIKRAVLEKCGFEVDVAVRSAGQMAAALASNPLLGKAGVDPQFLHATFLIGAPAKLSLKGTTLPLGPGEEAVLVGDTLYLYCPNGYGSTKINNTFFERKLGLRATTRNWRTVTELVRMACGGGAVT